MQSQSDSTMSSGSSLKKDYRVLGVIPARGGSKGIPRKNIRPLGGKPLLAYTIEAALASKGITDLVVSTDDVEIQSLAIALGAQAPFLRSAELSHDRALAVPTIQNAVEIMESVRKGQRYDYVMMLQPTTPFRSSNDIDQALKMIMEARPEAPQRQAEGLISIISVDNWHPMKMKKFMGERLVDYERPPVENPPRQTLPPVFMVNGAIYLTKRDVLMERGSFQGSFCLGMEMPPERSVNIDSDVDWVIAEYYLEKAKSALKPK